MSFDKIQVNFDHMKKETTYGDLKDIAEEALRAAGNDPNGEQLLLDILKGHGPDVVFMIRTLAETVKSLVTQLETEVAA